jgi:two-component system sensor histidine kinase SenX3
VEDTRTGIALDDQPRVFERFFRVDKARTTQKGGTGLGLAIVKHIVENRGGSVTVASAPGQGSVFTVRLPMPRP